MLLGRFLNEYKIILYRGSYNKTKIDSTLGKIDE